MNPIVLKFCVICLIVAIVILVWWVFFKVWQMMDRNVQARNRAAQNSQASHDAAFMQRMHEEAELDLPTYNEAVTNRRRDRQNSGGEELRSDDNADTEDRNVGGRNAGDDDDDSYVTLIGPAIARTIVISTAFASTSAGSATAGTSSGDAK